MELGTLSPDIDARFCYLIVMLAGMLTAVREVDSRLAHIPGAWNDIGAHRLFGFLWLTPVIIFFLLDHTGAINDTSPVAALVVALTYSAFVAGAGHSLPRQVTGLWAKLLGDPDRIQANAQARMQARLFQYVRAATRDIASKPARYSKLQTLARRLVADPQALDARMAELDQQYGGDPTLSAWKKTELLLRAIAGVYVARGLTEEVHGLLRREGLIGWGTYASFPGESVGGAWRNLSVLIPAGLIIAIAILSTTDRWNFERAWLGWRLSKTNATSVDLTRTREAFIDRFARSFAPSDELHTLGGIIREASMTPARVDTTIGIMTDAVRQRIDRDRLLPDLVVTLIISLRTANVDARARVHNALLYLADQRLKATSADNKEAQAVLDDLRKWKPSDSSSVTELAGRIDEWRRFFSQVK
ncbi:MAG TPA: hypothetical protein VFB13_04050 [Reyranella sp.]|nr:hypothetical protein [Reyranella sp.]